MVARLQKHIDQNFPFLRGNRLLIALSGGVDSMVLMNMLHVLGYDIAVAHCNFQLRGIDATNDQICCEQWAKTLTIPFFTTSFDTQNYAQTQQLSIQMAARELRYNWFKTLQAEHDFPYLITAHHANDSLETFLINLSRGTGLKGLLGVPAHQNNIVRPLLIFSKQEIIQYAKNHDLQWREDSSNTKDSYLRNHIRLNIVPELEKTNADFLTKFQETISYLSESDTIVQQAIQKARKEAILEERETEIVFDLQYLQQLSPQRLYLFHLFKPYGFSTVIDLERLLDSQSGKYLQTKDYKLIKNQNQLFLVKNETKTSFEAIEILPIAEKCIDLHPYIQNTDLETLPTLMQEVSVATEKLQFPLILRKWQSDDYFHPIGMQGKKKVGKYLKELKLSIHQKEAILVLCNANQKLIWIVGFRLDKKYKAIDNALIIKM